MGDSGVAIVKAVLSGDTLVLMGRPQNGPPPERQLSLSSLMAPKVARGPQSPEEPWGWKSREFLRRLVVGHQVSFKVDYKVAQINREFGTVMLNGESISRAIVREGWARVRPAGQSRDGEVSPEVEELVRLEGVATTEGKGVHAASQEGATRDIKWSDIDAEALLVKLKDKPTPMVLEYVRDGASFRAIIHSSSTYINLCLAGVRVNSPPKAAAAAAGGEAKPDPFALEARFFTESRLLQRDVDVVIGGVDKYGTFYGTVLHPKGNIALELLKNGLGRVVDYSIDFTSRDNAVQYRLAERTAKQQQLRIWRNYVAPTISGSKEYNATVVEVVSGDTLVVRVDADGRAVGEERKLSLASLRAPRQGNRQKGQPDEPWAAEAKEALRSRVIGRQVVVVVDYERELPIGDRKEKRAFASVYTGKGGKRKSLSESLVAEGFASVIRHRADDERAENYDDLISAEASAKSAKRGVHSGEAPPAPRVTDLSLDAKKARAHLSHLQRESDLRAVVDYVFSGSRFKVHIPSENCSLMMALSAVRTPNPSRAEAGGRTRAGDPFGEEAKAFSRQNLLQRTVELVIHDMDKNGVALGDVFLISPSGDKALYGAELLRHGLARIDDRGLSTLPGRLVSELQEAQAAAEGGKAGLWSLETEAKQEQEATVVAEEVLDVRVSEITDGTHFFVHVTSSDGLSSINQRMKALTEQEGLSSKTSFEPRKGNIVAALFDDGSGPLWYRARIEDKAQGGFVVLYIDYGNRATVPASKIRTIDSSYQATPAQAKEGTLAFVKGPALSEDYGEQAAIAFSNLAYGKQLTARVHAKEGSTLVATLVDAGSGKNINKALVEEGLARVSKTAGRLAKRLGASAEALLAELKEAQENARRGRLGMWRYGDVDSDDEY